MASHRRIKDIDYEEDDIYPDDEDEYGQHEQGYTAGDEENFRTLTPVVRAELEEAGLQASDRHIQDALWDSYWDVSASVTYLKIACASRRQQQQQQQQPKKEKAKSRFDQAAEQSAQKADCSPPGRPDADHWFNGVPWIHVAPEMIGTLLPLASHKHLPRLLGGSSKLAKLAEERRKKAAETQVPDATFDSTLGSLDRLSKFKIATENESLVVQAEPRKYPVRRKREPTPPPMTREPELLPQEDKVKVPDLRASPTAFGRALSTSQASHGHQTAMTLRDLLEPVDTSEAFEIPSPDDAVMRAQKTTTGSAKLKAKPDLTGLSQKTQAIKLDSAPSTTTEPKVRRKKIDVAKLWTERRSQEKPGVAFVVIGHVDHGKSTLMGRLLLDTGAVQQRDVDKYKKQAADLGKSSVALAWVMDTASDERERGITVEVAQHHFSTDKVDFTILDAPGHRDFVPAMIGGASMADLAVLVVDVNQLDSGMKGQTQEHIRLAKAAGLQRMVIAINKLDSTTPPWDYNLFESVKAEVVAFVEKAGFARENVISLPCSGLDGGNVVKPANEDGPANWIKLEKSMTLLQALEASASSRTSDDLVKRPLRMQIADVFRGGMMSPLSVSGRLNSGNVQVGDNIVILPSGECASVKGIDISGDSRDFAVVGKIATLHVEGDLESLGRNLRPGDLLCSAANPAEAIKSFTADVEAMESLLPQGADVHVGRLHVPGRVTQLVATVDRNGEVMKKKPRMVKAGQRARVKVELEDAMPVEAGDRLVLRASGSTIAAGMVDDGGK